MGATHFLMKTLPRVASEMALHVLAYNLTRVMNIMGIQPLMTVMRAQSKLDKHSASPLRRDSTFPAERFDTTKTHQRHVAVVRHWLSAASYDLSFWSKEANAARTANRPSIASMA
jgi:transposase